MTRLERERLAAGLSYKALGEKSFVGGSQISKAERGLLLYPGELARIAEVLDWKGDPAELLAEVDE